MLCFWSKIASGEVKVSTIHSVPFILPFPTFSCLTFAPIASSPVAIRYLTKHQRTIIVAVPTYCQYTIYNSNMGGEAAKERRRLKRLAQQQQNENGTVVESASSAVAQEVKRGGGNNALLRLQRKLARKASGKFKPLQGQSQQQASLSHKRKPESNKNRNPAAKSSPAKKFKGGSDHSSKKKRNSVKPAPVSKNMKQTKTKPNV